MSSGAVEDQLSELGRYAIAYARAGLRVFPLVPGAKVPMTEHGFKDAVTTEATIVAWWSRTPNANIGIATGARTGGGPFFVLDVDEHNPAASGREAVLDLEARYGKLPDTAEVLTPSGGRHLFYESDGAVVTNAAGGNMPAGIDVRGGGGYVVAAPSIHPNGSVYAWDAFGNLLDGVAIAPAPEWLIDLLTATPPQQAARRDVVPYEGVPRPGDRWAQTVAWPELLEPSGAVYIDTRRHPTGGEYETWARPGCMVDHGENHVGATLYYGGTDLLKIHTSAWPGLTEGATYTKFGYYAATQHHGDFGDAARALGRAAVAEANELLESSIATASSEGGKPAPPVGKPTVFTNSRYLDELSAEVVGHLQRANDPPMLFVRAGRPTRVRADEQGRPIIEVVDPEHLKVTAAETCRFGRTMKEGGFVPTPPPIDLMRSILAARSWPFPALTGITEAPILRPDGLFHTNPGYEAQTKLYHWTTVTYEPVPAAPTGEEVAAARQVIDDLLADFPFDTVADRGNAWGLLITPLVRSIIEGQVPMALLDAPEPGTGKGLLAQVFTTIATGRPAAMQPLPANGEELEKRITALLMCGAGFIVFDNVDGTISSHVLAAALTADTWQGRILGQSTTIDVPNRATWLATGNNIDVGGDLARRCYRIRLDARQARPWAREGFRHPDLLGYVKRHRTEILGALCTIIRSWWVAGRPMANSVSAMGTYTPWVRTVGGILEHAGVDGFLANLHEFHASADHEASAWCAFLTAWREHWSEGHAVTVSELIHAMEASDSTLRETLPDELSGLWGDKKFPMRLGRALVKRLGRHHGENGIHIVAEPRNRRNVAMYSVTARDAGVAWVAPGTEPVDNPKANVRTHAEGCTADQGIPCDCMGCMGSTPSYEDSESSQKRTGGPGGLNPCKPITPANTRSPEPSSPMTDDDLFGPDEPF